MFAGSYLLLLRHGSADPEPSSRPHDFYRDPLPEETARCRPLLVQVQRRVSELLTEWPEHPTLINVSTEIFSLEMNNWLKNGDFLIFYFILFI